MTISRSGSEPQSLGEALMGNTIFRPLVDALAPVKSAGVRLGVGSEPRQATRQSDKSRESGFGR